MFVTNSRKCDILEAYKMEFANELLYCDGLTSLTKMGLIEMQIL